PLAVTPASALLAARAEGIAYVNLCVSNNTGDDIRGAEWITGKPHPASNTRHLLVFGEEMRSSIYGHMQFFGIRQLVEPQYTGFDNTPQSNDFPANYVMAAEAVRQGGVVTYGHPMFAGKPDPYGPDPTAGNAAARELPIDAMLGVVQAVDLMSYNSDEELSTQLWYRLLNCGLKLTACVGTDALLDRSTDPMGGGRVYVKLDGPLNMKSWLDGLKRGRTFVTNGPIPWLQVEGQGSGGTCRLTKPGMVRVDVQVDSYVPIDRVDVIVNGQVAHSRKLQPNQPTGVRLDRFQIELPLERSSWLALRVHGPDSLHVIDGPAYAHTSPVYVLIAERPIGSSEDAAYFVDWIERLLRVVAVRNRYPSDKARREVEALFRKAQAAFRVMADQ
ncbi:MAG: CehA/McbA family metallohydrolase, partial [Planctomycetaceae bacterium]